MAGRDTRTGRLALWNDEAGYGFIETGRRGQRVFVHISSLVAGQRRPVAGDILSYNVTSGRDGRPAAAGVSIVGASTPADLPPRRVDTEVPRHVGLRLAFGLLMVMLVAAGLWLGRMPWPVAAAYVVMGLVDAATYWADKRAARAGQWRIAERTLHALDFCFGIAGGLLAQALLRHKTSKLDFAATTATIAALHLGALIFLVVR